MSLDSNKTVIKRFTYDWLIRFAELHPFEIRGYFSQPYCPTGLYNPHRSKYAAISPLFTTLITKNMPYLVYEYELNTQNCKSISYSLPSHKRKIIFVSKTYSFYEQATGAISWLKDNRTTFYGESLYINDAAITPEELQCFFKICYFDNIVKVKSAYATAIAANLL
uniref:BTB domain-containing protein n=1 Tax=Panagrellus redivivus TaxID=6233 RepID=A0A7E4ZQS4_PANRE